MYFNVLLQESSHRMETDPSEVNGGLGGGGGEWTELSEVRLMKAAAEDLEFRAKEVASDPAECNYKFLSREIGKDWTTGGDTMFWRPLCTWEPTGDSATPATHPHSKLQGRKENKHPSPAPLTHRGAMNLQSHG